MSIDKEKIKRYYDNKKERIGPGVDSVMDHFANRIQGSTILDVGCGTGEFCCKLLNLGAKEVVGIDISLKYLKGNIDEKIKQIKFFEMDAEDLKFSPEYFDVVFALEVVEHLENTQKVLKDINKILKKEGLLILTAPNWFNIFFIFKKILEFLTRQKYWSPGGQPIEQNFTPYKLKRMLISAGFEILEYHTRAFLNPYTKIIPFRKLRSKILNSYYNKLFEKFLSKIPVIKDSGFNMVFVCRAKK